MVLALVGFAAAFGLAATAGAGTSAPGQSTEPPPTEPPPTEPPVEPPPPTPAPIAFGVSRRAADVPALIGLIRGLAEYERMAMQFGQKPNQVRKAYEQNDLVPELVSQIRKSKALDWLLHHVEMVDPAGRDPGPHR